MFYLGKVPAEIGITNTETLVVEGVIFLRKYLSFPELPQVRVLMFYLGKVPAQIGITNTETLVVEGDLVRKYLSFPELPQVRVLATKDKQLTSLISKTINPVM